MSDSRSRDEEPKDKKSKKSKKSKSSKSERAVRSRSPRSKKSKKERKRSRSPAPKKSSSSRRRSRKSRSRSRGRSRDRRRKRDKKRGYKPVSSGSSSDDWKNTSEDDADSGSSRERSPKRTRRHRGRSASRSSRSSSGSSSSSFERPSYRNGGYRGRNWRGGGRPPRSALGRGRFRPDAPTLRGRGYWRPNYIAYGRNIFPGGESSETHSDSSRSWSSTSRSRSATPEHYKPRDTPEHSPEPKREKTPEKGLMDTIQQQEIERINNIMAQLDRAGKESQQKVNGVDVRRGQFVGTFGAEKDIFEESIPLRKEKPFKERADFHKDQQLSTTPLKKKQKLFDYNDANLPQLDAGMSLRKQMQEKENKERAEVEREKQQRQLEQETRIANRASQVAAEQMNNENGFAETEPTKEIIARRRKSANLRSDTTDTDAIEDLVKTEVPEAKNADAEFISKLEKDFEKERGMKIRIKGPQTLKTGTPSFSELAAKMASTGRGVMRGKVASSGLKSSAFGVPKILGRRDDQKFLKPNLKEHLESMDAKNENLLYKQRKQEEMEKQGELVQEQILSTAPLQSTNIGPIKPVAQTTARRLNKTGVVLPVNLTEKKELSPGGSSGAQVTTNAGWKEPPKSGWNESPPRPSVQNTPVQKIHATPNVTLARVSDQAPITPPVIRRDYSAPVVHQYPPPLRGPPPVIHRVYSTPPPPIIPVGTVAKTSSVILKREFDSDSEGPTPPPPTGDVDLGELYARHPQLWQGFVTIKKHAAMVQLHYLSGDKLLVQSVLPVFPTMTGSDNSKHPALKITSRVKLEPTTFDSLRTKMRETGKYTFLLGLPCGVSESDVERQKATLRVNFMQYFSSKAAAGVVEINCDGVEYLVYVFPHCELMSEQLSRCGDFRKQTADLPQLMIAIFPSS